MKRNWKVLTVLCALLVFSGIVLAQGGRQTENSYFPAVYKLVFGTPDETNNVTFQKTAANVVTATGSVTVTAGLSSATTATASNCASSASPSVCAAATAGSVAQAASAGTLVVNTTAVTAASQILVTEDSSLGTRLSVTCNVTPAAPSVSARTAGTSFTIASTAPTTNPRCLSFRILN